MLHRPPSLGLIEKVVVPMDDTPVLPLDRHAKSDESSSSNGLCDLLPDEILIHILSFLSLRDAAKTSPLSKRWKYLWAFVPNLTLDDGYFRPPNETHFSDFVDRVFSIRGESPIVEFSLHCEFPGDPYLIERCLPTVLRCNPEKLCLILHQDSSPNVFAFPLKSENLKELRLDSAFVFAPPPSICLPNLRVLELSDVILVDRDALERLFSSPSLESLSISRCRWRKIMKIHISAPNLQSLYIDEGFDEGYCENMFPFTTKDAVSHDRQVDINGASLKSFSYWGELINQYHISGDTTRLLEKGEINVVHPYGDFEMDKVVTQEFKLLTVVANVKELILSDQILEDVGEQDVHLDTLPLFRNVTSLRLDGHIYYPSFRGLSKILRRSPRLSSLAFSELFRGFPEKKRARLLDPLPSCFRTELKQITVDDFGGEFCYVKDQVNVVGLLLKTATALEKMNIYYSKNYINAKFLNKHIGTLPRGSENCRVYYVRVGPSS